MAGCGSLPYRWELNDVAEADGASRTLTRLKPNLSSYNATGPKTSYPLPISGFTKTSTMDVIGNQN